MGKKELEKECNKENHKWIIQGLVFCLVLVFSLSLGLIIQASIQNEKIDRFARASCVAVYGFNILEKPEKLKMCKDAEKKAFELLG